MQTGALYISAASKSSGKTIVSVGIAAALRERGIAVQTFKKGPDYIDPMWLAAASGRPCRNLDFHTMSESEIRFEFRHHRPPSPGFRLFEGTKGLHDGVSIDGSDSNAALARLLDIEVALVIDTRGMTRGIAPLLLGYRNFDPDLARAGVILNRSGGSRHEAKLIRAVETFTDWQVLGVLGNSPALSLDSGHLGLVPPPSTVDDARRVDDRGDDRASKAKTDAALDPAPEKTLARPLRAMAEAIEKGIDLSRLLEASKARRKVEDESIAFAATPPEQVPEAAPTSLPQGFAASACSPGVRIGIAWDAAFRFYYPGDLESLAREGAELVFFDTLRDSHLPQVDGVFIGGGFPERAAADLEKNTPLRLTLRRAIEKGLAVYAECGGLMYLARSIRSDRFQAEMVGAIPGDIRMHTRPQGRGYALLSPTGAAPWQPAGEDPLPAHEFHHSSIDNLPSDGWSHAYRVRRGYGIDGEKDGIVIGNLLASYCHLRDVQGCRWTRRFVDFLRRQKLSSLAERALAEPEDSCSLRAPIPDRPLSPALAKACGNIEG
ncbi:MAG: cobyrinate a,c-diamide synthase [Ectothiorhodospiraceae bacterium AqS1]|nr:cobyrinate a,c-diamide synthase [Ectothiorhodospiraceae bacterium AqS1]